MMSLEFIVLILAIVAVAYLSFDLARDSLRERREREHLDRLVGSEPETPAAAEPGAIDRFLKSAGFRGPIEAYLFAVSVFAVVISLLVWSLMPGLPGLALVVFCMALYLPWTLTKEWGRIRSRRFERRLIEAIDLMAGALYAGGNLTHAFKSAGAAGEEPVRSEFSEVERRLTLGMPLPRAVGHMIEAHDGEGVRLFTQTLIAKNQAGGDLAPVLRTLNETLRDRFRQQRQLQSQLAGARISAIAVALLPYLLLPVLLWMKPDWLMTLRVHPLGMPLLTFAFLLQLIGILWVWRILSREF